MENATFNYLLLASPFHAHVSGLKNVNHVDNTVSASLINGKQEGQTEALGKPWGPRRKGI